jgi:hypothetical protein
LVCHAFLMAAPASMVTRGGLNFPSQLENQLLLTGQVGCPLTINRSRIKLALVKIRAAARNKAVGKLLGQLLTPSMLAYRGLLHPLVCFFEATTSNSKFGLFDSQEQHGADHSL